jgi:beta-lactamase class A
MRRLTLVLAGVVAIAATAALLLATGREVLSPASAGDDDSAQAKGSTTGPYPSGARVRDAKRFAAGRSGTVSFAVIGPKGGLRGRAPHTRFSSASVTKAMMLAAYLRSHKRIDTSAKGLLRPMITLSDNDAANAIYAVVGDEGLERVAHRAGMRDFEPTPGFWGGAQITAADMARFFDRLEDNLGRRHRSYGLKLLAGITSFERWGIPAGSGAGWRIWFKGGWRPGGGENSSGAVSHQAALLRYRDGTRVAIAVLTDETPGEGEGYGTIEGIAERLLHPPPAVGPGT